MPSGARWLRHAASTASRTRLRRPRVQAVHDHVVELAELARRSARARRRRRSARCRAPRPRRSPARSRSPSARGRRRPRARRGRPPRCPRGSHRAPQPSSSTRAARGSGGVEPVQHRDGREDRGPRLRERQVRVRDLVVGSRHLRNLFPRGRAARLGLHSSAGRRGRTPQHLTGRSRRGAADAAAARARAPRLRGRRDRVRRARQRLVGQAHRADGQPLPLRPARERSAESEAYRRATCASTARHGGAAADAPRGHLRRHGLDEGGRGRAPAALAGAGDPLLPHLAARRPARRPARGRKPAARDRDRGRPARRRRRPTSGPRSAAATRRRSTTPIRLEVESGLMFTRGPEVRTQTVRLEHRTASAAHDGGARSASAASCATRDGEPVADAWVVLPDLGR